MIAKNEIIDILNDATRAPSTHNSQPWLVRILTDKCLVYKDINLSLPFADPLGRDQFISIGCFLESIVIASRFRGFTPTMAYFPEDNDGAIAEIIWSKVSHDKDVENTNQRLFDALKARTNSRGPFLNEPIAEVHLADINDALKIDGYFSSGNIVKYVTDTDNILQIAEVTANGMLIAHSSRGFRKESSRWIAPNPDKRLDGLPSHSLKVRFPFSYLLPHIIKNINCGPLLSKLVKKSVASSPLVCIIGSHENTEKSWVSIGHIAQRLFLELTSYGYSTSIYMAAIEINELHKDLESIASLDFIPHFLFCAGKMDHIPKATQRHPIFNKILD